MRKRDQERLTRKRRERMKAIVVSLQRYMESYDKQQSYLDYEDATVIEDVLYGLGVALGPEEYCWGTGFDKFKARLREHLKLRDAAPQRHEEPK